MVLGGYAEREFEQIQASLADKKQPSTHFSWIVSRDSRYG
jgi:hypothetical protein